ncbi:glutathione ABC transporter substrate-binding protein [Solibacillus sp. MA9]|uniref:Glutathione-binding protein GsiB n=1 Tax=Solibacillus palustris TaxID=2908203 RepID=A0ABS9UHG9_9BACL|nr:glutathione ABC transporter substrate-binding protein [Solibacillus sp. MA9]MCH7323408.1 glutathione ABC transporter substrate-binding protein [Solibacillus sp. MA9]
MKYVKNLAWLLVVMLFLVACSSDDSNSASNDSATDSSTKSETTYSKDTTTGENSDEIVIAVNENFISMDPHNTGDTNSNSVQSAMLEGLLGYDGEGNIINVLATEYNVSDDALEYSFKLREGVQFHDGEAFNAEAVKVNVERIMNDEKLRLYSRGFNIVKSVDVVSDYEVKVTLTEPYGPMITRFAAAKMISPKMIKEQAAEIPKSVVGTGPYKFVEWIQGDHLTVERNEDYWDGADRVSKITYKPVPENGSRVAMLKTGEADVIYPVPPQNINELNSNKDVEINQVPSTIARYVSLNTFKEPLNNEKVRLALNHAVDKDAFIKVVNSGLGLPLDSIIPSKTIFYKKQEMYNFDVEKAKSLLAEAGYPDGFEIEIWGNTNSDTMKGMQFIQQQLSKINVKVEIKSMEEATLSDEIYGAQTPEEAKLMMWYVSWSAYPSDVTNATKPLFHSSSFPPNSANTAYYNNPTADKLMDEANSISDQSKQEDLYGQLQEEVYASAPWIFLGVDEIVYGVRSDVSGVIVNPGGGLDVRDAKVK